jgi:putative ABC transport system permease protein
MGIALLQGRDFERTDAEREIMANVIISESAAALLFPGEDPIGKRVRPATAAGDHWFTVTGVVEDVRVDDLRRASPEPMVYLPGVATSPAYVIRSPRADQLGPEVRAVIREVIPESPMYRVFTMERLSANAMASLSFTMFMVSTAAALALVLGAVGLYGVLSSVVTRRRREIAVRMALGAEASAVRRMVVVQGGRVALTGIALGLAASFAVMRLLESMLFGVAALDPLTYIGMSAAMLAVAFLASYLPARRASSVDPLQSLTVE